MISIIMPVYNTDSVLLTKCLESILRQTNQDFELLIIDDGSTDEETIKVCDCFANISKNASVFHRVNNGVSAARNYGLYHATGSWIAFIDADDWIDPSYLGQLVSRAHGEACDIVFCDCYVEFKNHSVSNAFIPETVSHQIDSSNIREQLLLQILGQNKCYNPPEIGIGVPWGKLYRHDFLLSHELKFDESLKRMQDNVFNLYAFKQASAISYVPEKLYHYNNIESSASHKFNPNIVNDFAQVHESTEQFLERFEFDQTILQGYYSRVIQSIHPILRYYFFHEKYPENKKTMYSEIKTLLSKEPYITAMRKADYTRMPVKMFIYALLLKFHLFTLMRLIISRE